MDWITRKCNAEYLARIFTAIAAKPVLQVGHVRNRFTLNCSADIYNGVSASCSLSCSNH